MITVEALVKLANHAATSPDVSLDLVRELARGVLDQLGPGDDCGFERPEIVPWSSPPEPTRGVRIPESWAADHVPDDASALGRMILRYADGAREVAAELEARKGSAK